MAKNDADTWKLIHAERAAVADTLASLNTDQWAVPSLCEGWPVHIAAAHIVAGAEQT
ncbi:MAG: maleylpyruvate isomerase N-terminal domain-containing protein, partial [Acidimicrobiales bacterium]